MYGSKAYLLQLKAEQVPLVVLTIWNTVTSEIAVSSPLDKRPSDAPSDARQISKGICLFLLKIDVLTTIKSRFQVKPATLLIPIDIIFVFVVKEFYGTRYQNYLLMHHLMHVKSAKESAYFY